MKKNILFIGGAGFIGSAVIREMVEAEEYNNQIYILEPESANLQRLDGIPVRVYRGDISNIELIADIIEKKEISTIVHLVSTMVPGSGYDEYKKEFENVIFPTVRLMQLCSRMNVKFVYFSSGGTVYGERKTLKPFVETDPKEPISYYGLSKQMIENSVLFENRVSNLRYLILRPSNPYGRGQNIYGRQGLIAVAIGKVLAGEPVVIWGDGNTVRDFIYIDDLAKIVAKLLDNRADNMIVNIGSNMGYSINEVMEMLNDIADEDLKLNYLPSRKNDVSNMILDTTIMKSLVDINLTPLRLGLSRFYEYEKRRK